MNETHLMSRELFDPPESYERAMERATEAVVETYLERAMPYSGASPDDLRSQVSEIDLLPESGIGLERAMDRVGELYLSHSVQTHDPRCIAHLHCPPLLPGLVAEMLISATNQSLDSWDQSPAGSVLEEAFMETLCSWFGFSETADGVITSGGTQSNFMGMLLARNRFAKDRYDHDVQSEGLPAGSFRVLCSEAAHFTIEQAVAHLGLGEDSVVGVPVDEQYRMDLAALDAILSDLDSAGAEPIALIGTAGTTDFGSIDPLVGLAERAEEHDLWFHVDAAYGGALALSDTHRDKLEGIERADSIGIDFHKLLFQPISCGAFLLHHEEAFQYMARNAAYLNPESAERAVPNHVEKSVQTTRRFDALKPILTFQAIGQDGIATRIDHLVDLTERAGKRIEARPQFELKHRPELTALVFRYRPSPDACPPHLSVVEWTNEINEAIRDRAFSSGEAIVARTEHGGEICLKFTILSPNTSITDIEGIIETLDRLGGEMEAT